MFWSISTTGLLNIEFNFYSSMLYRLFSILLLYLLFDFFGSYFYHYKKIKSIIRFGIRGYV